jgi:hypothetical protein
MERVQYALCTSARFILYCVLAIGILAGTAMIGSLAALEQRWMALVLALEVAALSAWGFPLVMNATGAALRRIDWTLGLHAGSMIALGVGFMLSPLFRARGVIVPVLVGAAVLYLFLLFLSFLVVGPAKEKEGSKRAQPA